jgi:hypothetical protein
VDGYLVGPARGLVHVNLDRASGPEDHGRRRPLPEPERFSGFPGLGGEQERLVQGQVLVEGREGAVDSGRFGHRTWISGE